MSFEKKYKITAVVVTYNRQKLLMECLEALYSQTYVINEIIVVNNNSNDGTKEYLDSLLYENLSVIHLSENIGGAGGFSLGVEEAYKRGCDFVLIQDDDCILNKDYVELLISGREMYLAKHSGTLLEAMAGRVITHDKIALDHRGYINHKNIIRSFRPWREFNEADYNNDFLICNIVSFCGLMISSELIKQIGIPKKEYFIRCDDTEYSLRISRYSDILLVCGASLNHKVKSVNKANQIDSKLYYDIRNIMDLCDSNRLNLFKVKCRVKYYIKSLASSEIRAIYKDAILDYKNKRYGKNEKY